MYGIVAQRLLSEHPPRSPLPSPGTWAVPSGTVLFGESGVQRSFGAGGLFGAKFLNFAREKFGGNLLRVPEN